MSNFFRDILVIGLRIGGEAVFWNSPQDGYLNAAVLCRTASVVASLESLANEIGARFGVSVSEMLVARSNLTVQSVDLIEKRPVLGQRRDQALQASSICAGKTTALVNKLESPDMRKAEKRPLKDISGEVLC